ncbi:MAG: hypothetical protein ACK4GN_00325 [Runella sp.]
MKQLHFILLFWLVAPLLQAQTENANNLIRDVDGRLNMGSYMTSAFDSRYEGIKGSPFFISTWSKGTMIFADGRVFKEVPLKYNAYTKELIMKRPSGDSLIVFPYQVQAFVINDTLTKAEFVFRRYPNAQTPKQDFREVYFLSLYEGKNNSLVKLVRKNLKKADYKDPYSNDVRYDTYEDANEYYLLKNNSQMLKIKRNKKSVLEALADKKNEIKALIDQKKWEFKKEEELISAIVEYDAL